MINRTDGKIKLWLPTIKCSQCGKVVNARQITTIVERVRGRITGRQIHLCPGCRFDFYKKSMKLSEANLNEKLRIEEWNKDKLQSK